MTATTEKLSCLLLAVSLAVVTACGDDDATSTTDAHNDDTQLAEDSQLADDSQQDTSSPDADAPEQDTSAEDTTAPGSLTFEQFKTEGAVVLCEAIFRCCDAAEAAWLLEDDTITAESCPAMFEALLDSEAQAWGVAQGFAVFNEEDAAACVALVTGVSCDRVPNVFTEAEGTACGDLFVGAVERGQPCLEDDHCVTGNCFYADPGAIEGVCTPVSLVNEPCQGGDCDRDLYCDYDVTGTCQPRPADGETCQDLWVCADGFFCDIDAALPGVCSALKGGGEPCTDGQECASGGCTDEGLPQAVCEEPFSADMCDGI